MKFVPIPDDLPGPDSVTWRDPMNSKEAELPEDMGYGDAFLDLADHEHVIVGVAPGQACRVPLDPTMGDGEDKIEALVRWRTRATATNRPRLDADGEVF